MKIDAKTAEFEGLLNLAKSICVAIRTAPKACGIDNIETLILTGEDKAALTAGMREIAEEYSERKTPFARDAGNIDEAQVLVLAGITRGTRKLNEICQLCGFENCAACQEAGAVCVFAGIDLGIALGSAAAMAANNHADNRIMYTAGKAAQRLGLLGEYEIIMGLPLYAGGKNVFFDRAR